MRSGLGHPAPGAGIANPALLARERDHAITAATIAVHSNETTLGDSASQELAERTFHEGRQRVAPLLRRVQKTIKLRGYHAVEQRGLGASRFVLARGGCGAERRHASRCASPRMRVDDAGGMNPGADVTKPATRRVLIPRV